MTNSLRSICVYCGSADGLKQVYLDAAFGLGQLLARQGITLVYGAGKTGLMGAVADGALSVGGEVIGIVPHNLNTSALIHAGLTRLETSENMHTRKARMSELAEAFIALPGGLGTFDELFETLTWVQIGLHHKPVGLLNTMNYYDPLLALIEHASNEGFLYAEHRHILVHSPQPEALLDQLRGYTPPDGLERWVNRPNDD
ncbi:MAG: TIGR00730 family Rossman fold protein [Anaerolineaceae bacterium]|nr:TIGR00730 family Rossman fold protein [Anaerolineaceae bacterium]